MRNNESEDMYLKTIYNLSKKMSIVRAIDIVNERCCAKSSVSRAVGLLKTKGLIDVKPEGDITITEVGMVKVLALINRYESLLKLFSIVGLSKEEAEINACKIEHDITTNASEAIKKFTDNY